MTVTKTTKKSAAVSSEQREKRRRGKSKKASPFRRAHSAWIFFTTENRPAIRKAHPDAEFGEIAKLVAKQWKTLSPEEKKPYEDQAREEKLQVKEYNDQVRKNHPELVEAYFAEKKLEKDSSKKKKSNRGSNNFLLFSHSVRAKVKEQYPQLTPAKLQIEIGKMWHALSDDERSYWRQEWEKQKLERESTSMESGE